MKTCLIAVFILSAFYCNAQRDSLHINNDKLNRQIDSSIKQLDSMNQRINEGYKQTMHTMDSINMHLEQERNNRALDSFLRMQKEREEKQKKAMWIRLGIGVLFLGVLIFGLLRRRKTQNKT